MSRVRLAIGIPTRNRADAVMTAVASVVASADPRVALVVSDNSTDPDAARQVRAFCAEQPDWVRYVRVEEPLSMAAHWERLWQRIRELAGPTHVAYLSDRMVFADGAVADLLGIAEAHPGRVVSYRADRVDDLVSPARLVQVEWSGRLLELDARRLIEHSSREILYSDHLPRLNNCIAPVELVTRIERRFGDVFGPVSPDYAFAFRTLALDDAILHLDRACLVQFGLALSNGFSVVIGRPNESADHFARSLPIAPYGATPAPEIRTIANAMFEEYGLAREHSGDHARFPPIDPHGYLAENALAATWIADPSLRATVEEQLRRRGWTRGAQARATLSRWRASAAFFARHPRALRHHRSDDDAPAFDDVGDALVFASAHPRPPTPHPRHLEPLRRSGVIARAV